MVLYLYQVFLKIKYVVNFLKYTENNGQYINILGSVIENIEIEL